MNNRYKKSINLAEDLLSTISSHSAPTIWWQGQEIAKKQLSASIYYVATEYMKLGIKSGERVLISLPDSPSFISHFLGAILVGIVPAPISTSTSPRELDWIIRDSTAKAIVTTENFANTALRESARLKNISVIKISFDLPFNSQEVHLNISRLLKHQNLNSFVAFWQYTSGSTGKPKAVMHCHGSASKTAELYAKGILGITRHDRIFSIAKMSFGYGLGNSLFFPLYLGATSVLHSGSFTPPAIAEILKESKATVLFGVPSAYGKLLSAVREGMELDLSSVRLCVSAGEALPSPLQKQWEEQFVLPILDGIGSTELLHIYVSNSPDKVVKGSLGRVVPGYQARIVDMDGNEVPPGVHGHLEIRGPSTMLGYWKKPVETKKVMHGKWIRTGDIFVKDCEDIYWFQGRFNEMLKIKGLWVSPVEVENVLLENHDVIDAVVYGDVDEKGLTIIKAQVITNMHAKDNIIAQSLNDFVSNRLSSHKCPAVFEFVKHIRKTQTGKKNRLKLKDDFIPRRKKGKIQTLNLTRILPNKPRP